VKLSERLAEERRLVILRLLSEMPRYAANESVLKTGLEHFGLHAGSDLVRADIHYLEAHLLVEVDRLDAAAGVLLVVTLLVAGKDVADGVSNHVGVARRGLD
jgi:hypothetical protein